MPLKGNTFVLIAVQLVKSVVDWSTQSIPCVNGPVGPKAMISKLPSPKIENVKIVGGAGRWVVNIVTAKVKMNFFINTNVA
jgi:hypothetical protein